MARYDIGDEVRLAAVFTDENLVAKDPTTITLTILHPDATTTTPTPTHDSTGHYSYVLLIDDDGDWVCRWTGTGAVVAAQEDEFFVRARRVT